MSSDPLSMQVEINQLLFISHSGRTYNLNADFLDFRITESIMSPFTRGHIVINDLNAITEIGEATIGGYLQIKFRTSAEFPFYEKTMWVYKVGDDSQLEGARQYKRRKIVLFFCSFNMRAELRERYSKYYENMLPHEIVQDVCTNILEIGDLATVDKTQDRLTIVTPYAWSPLGIIDYCKRKSFSVVNQDTGYVFFENNLGFHYVSLSELLKQSYKYELTMEPPDNQFRQKYFGYVSKIVSYKTVRHLDMIESWMSHRFGGSIHTVKDDDIRFTEEKSNLSGYLPTTMNLGTKTTTVSQADNDKAIHVSHYGTFPQYKFNQYMRYNLMEDNHLSVICPGDSRKLAGDIVKIRYPSKHETQITNQQLDGNWIIHSLTHHFNQKRHYRNEMILAKDALKQYPGPTLNTGKNNT